MALNSIFSRESGASNNYEFSLLLNAAFEEMVAMRVVVLW